MYSLVPPELMVLRLHEHMMRHAVAFGLKLLNAPGDFDGRDPLAFAGQPAPERLNKFLDFLSDLASTCQKWAAGHPLHELDSLSAQWSSFTVLTDFFFHVMTVAVDFYKTSLSYVFDRLKITSLLEFVKCAMTAFATLAYCGTSAYAMNGDAFCSFGVSIGTGIDGFGNSARWLYQFKVALVLEQDGTRFVQSAIEAFGGDSDHEASRVSCLPAFCAAFSSRS